MNELFHKIEKELLRQPLRINRFRTAVGKGRSQTFGVVNKRSMPADYSVQCWKRAYLYYILLEFGRQFIHISFNAITLNQNCICKPHKDNNNSGITAIVSFGTFQGGELYIHTGPDAGMHDIKGRVLYTDLSNHTHSTQQFSGNRFSIVYYNCPHKHKLQKPSVQFVDGKYLFFRGTVYIDKQKGIFHPLKTVPYIYKKI